MDKVWPVLIWLKSGRLTNGADLRHHLNFQMRIRQMYIDWYKILKVLAKLNEEIYRQSSVKTPS